MKSVTVSSNDPKNPKFKLTLKGNVQVLASFEPAYLRLGRMAVGSEKTETVKVTAKEPSKLKIEELRPSNPDRVSAKLVQGKGGPTVELKIKAGDREGRISESIVARTNLKDPKEIRLNISGTVSRDLWVDPPRVFFPGFDEKNRPTTALKVASLSGARFKVTGVKDEAGAVEGRIEQSGGGFKAVLVLTKNPEKKTGKLQITTNAKKQPVIEVPYTVGVRSRARRAVNPSIRPRPVPKPVKALRRTPPTKKP